MESLHEVLEELEEQEKEQQPFMVTDVTTAAEAQRRIVYFKEKENEIESIVESQVKPFLKKIEKIKEWGEKAKEEHTERQKYYQTMLETFWRLEVQKVVESGKKPKKTLKLPYGSVSLKKQQPEFLKDEDLLFKYAKESGFTNIKESTDWANLKKDCQVVGGRLVNEDGEVIPGVEVVEREDKFEMKLN